MTHHRLRLPAQTRLTKLMGMTGSAHDSEALTALRYAQRLMSDEKVTWEEVIGGREGPSGHAAFQEGRTAGFEEGYAKGYREGQNAPRARPRSWQAIVREMLDQPDGLSEWEEGFLKSFQSRHWHTPTERQRAVLERIAEKFGMELPGT